MSDYIRTAPAADRLRPTSFDDMSGQKHLVGERGVLRRLASSGRIPSMIFFGTCFNSAYYGPPNNLR